MTSLETSFSAETLVLDAKSEVDRIVAALRAQLRVMRRRGFVLGLSGGIDSSVCAALAVRAVGSGNVVGLFMPENDSDPESQRLGQLVADTFGIEGEIENIGPILEATGCYARRDAFIREAVPEYAAGWRSKLVFANGLTTAGYNISSLVVENPAGETWKVRLSANVYMGIVAATNMKQRTRKQLEYFHADRLKYAVLGTPNRLEDDQGFFVKNGDGAADVKPIAHLYKSQVYQLAEYLGVPEEVRRRPPTTDTFSLPQTQEEFYFVLPYDRLDLCLYALDNGVPANEVAKAVSLSEEQVALVWADIAAKRKVAHYLHLPAQRADAMPSA